MPYEGFELGKWSLNVPSTYDFGDGEPKFRILVVKNDMEILSTPKDFILGEKIKAELEYLALIPDLSDRISSFFFFFPFFFMHALSMFK